MRRSAPENIEGSRLLKLPRLDQQVRHLVIEVLSVPSRGFGLDSQTMHTVMLPKFEFLAAYCPVNCIIARGSPTYTDYKDCNCMFVWRDCFVTGFSKLSRASIRLPRWKTFGWRYAYLSFMTTCFKIQGERISPPQSRRFTYPCKSILSTTFVCLICTRWPAGIWICCGIIWVTVMIGINQLKTGFLLN